MGVTGCTPSMYLMASAVADEKISIINKAYSICPKFFQKKIYTKLIEINDKKITNIEYYHHLANELLNIKDVEEVTKNIKIAKYINILGKTSVLEFIEVIRRAQFVITNDTGAYHIALGLEVPVSIITGGYTYDGFVTYNFKNNPYKKPYIITDKRECFNCNSNCKYLEKGQDKWPCLHAVTVDYAWKTVEQMINDIN